MNRITTILLSIAGGVSAVITLFAFYGDVLVKTLQLRGAQISQREEALEENLTSAQSASEELKELLRLAREELERKEKTLQQKNKFIENNLSIPDADSKAFSGIPANVASTYRLVYIQLIHVVERTGLPSQEMAWLRARAREGKLHNILEAYTITAVDPNSTPASIAAVFRVEIDWEKARLTASYGSNIQQYDDRVYNQPIMDIADAFKQICIDEKLEMKDSVTTVQSPNEEILRTLGLDAHQFKQNDEFRNEMFRILNISPAGSGELSWRKGRFVEEIRIEQDSQITPALKVKFRYMKKSIEDTKQEPLL